jgi:secreted trypsin-like serine protease
VKKIRLLILVLAIAFGGLQAQTRVTGGFPINIAEAPWQVLLSRNNDLCCGGSVIAPNFILTAETET